MSWSSISRSQSHRPRLHAHGPPFSLQEASQVLETARQVGINFFDHADIYGRGESEVRFAQAS